MISDIIHVLFKIRIMLQSMMLPDLSSSLRVSVSPSLLHNLLPDLFWHFSVVALPVRPYLIACLAIWNFIWKASCFQEQNCFRCDSLMVHLTRKCWAAGNYLIRIVRKKDCLRWIIITSITIVILVVYVVYTCALLAVYVIAEEIPNWPCIFFLTFCEP